MDANVDISQFIGHKRPMNDAISDLLAQTGRQIRKRRLSMNLTQAEAAAKSGVAYRTWRRMEKDGSASIEDLIRAAIAMRCERGLGELFPELAASSMDELLRAQQAAAKLAQRRKTQRARR
jgi:transcriptional regulator with XRE-family HTH domain